MSLNNLTPEEYADQAYKEAQKLIFCLLQLCHATNQDDYSLGADFRQEVEENPEDPFRGFF